VAFVGAGVRMLSGDVNEVVDGVAGNQHLAVDMRHAWQSSSASNSGIDIGLDPRAAPTGPEPAPPGTQR
jgi:hypothetical protein